VDTRSLRRTTAGACLILGPAVLVLVEILHPKGDSDAATQLSNVAGSTGGQYWAHALALVATVLFVPAVLGLVHLTRSGRAMLAHVGGALTGIGLIALAAIVGTELVVWQAAKNPDTAAMTTLVDQIMQSSGFIPLYAAALGLPIGFIVLAVALRLTGTAPTWAAAAIGIAPAVQIGNELAYGPKWLNVVTAIVLLLGAGTVGSHLLTETDEEWEAVPVTAS
jgi:hypothetical protein